MTRHETHRQTKAKTMTYLSKTTLAAAIAFGAFGASASFAGDGDGIPDRLQLRDGSCLDQVQELLAADETLTMDQIRKQLRDGSCLLDPVVDDDTVADDTDDDTTVTAQKIRTRTGEDNGKGTVARHRNEGGSKAQNGGGRN
jgi:hypothetical protein